MLLQEMGLPEAKAQEFDALLKYHVDLIRKQSHRPSMQGPTAPLGDSWASPAIQWTGVVGPCPHVRDIQ